MPSDLPGLSSSGADRVGLWVISGVVVVVGRVEALSSVECEAVTLQLGAKWFARLSCTGT